MYHAMGAAQQRVPHVLQGIAIAGDSSSYTSMLNTDTNSFVGVPGKCPKNPTSCILNAIELAIQQIRTRPFPRPSKEQTKHNSVLATRRMRR